MRKEQFGLFLIATSSYAFLVLVSLVRMGAIGYSPYDFVLGITLGLLVVVLVLVFIVGLAIVIQEAAHRRHQPWL